MFYLIIILAVLGFGYYKLQQYKQKLNTGRELGLVREFVRAGQESESALLDYVRGSNFAMSAFVFGWSRSRENVLFAKGNTVIVHNGGLSYVVLDKGTDVHKEIVEKARRAVI